MNIHEYQAKNLLLRYGVAIPDFAIALSEKEIIAALRELGLNEAVIKIQVHAGGRGKGGGVKFGKTPDEILALARPLLGMKFVNNQTGPQGIVVDRILLSAPIDIKKEYYLAATIDREKGLPIIIVSAEGGTEIEEIAQKTPEKILKIPICLTGKVHSYHLWEAAKFLGWEGKIRKQGMELIAKVALAFIETDASLLEINPLALSHDDTLYALDAKLSVDDNALYRQPALAQCYDPSQQTQNEVLAKQFNLAYIGLDGEIGCLVNGAGLAMATMDIIRHYGGSPANFLDVGGGATKEQITHGFKIILMDPHVKSIFVNIFGGIMDCALLAQGIVDASTEDGVKVPLIVRMEGTNVEKGKKILKDSNLNIITADTMADGAIKSVKAAHGEK